jgi:putative zinc finger/helix-turn-helix YgiT family protein
MKMKGCFTGFCPGCLKETELKEIKTAESIKVRGEIFSVPVHYYKCLSCGEEFMNLFDPIDPLDSAYREYRKKHGWLQPEEIKEFRKSYNLTQKELAAILSLGDVTLSRYENGGLQDAGHDKMLRMAMNPQVLLKLIDQTPEAIPDCEKCDRIIQRIVNRLNISYEPEKYLWHNTQSRKNNAPYWIDWEKTGFELYPGNNVIQLAA